MQNRDYFFTTLFIRFGVVFLTFKLNIMNEEIITLEEGYWYATNHLAYKWVEEPIDDLRAKKVCKLHQLWQSSSGQQEWKEIPIIE